MVLTTVDRARDADGKTDQQNQKHIHNDDQDVLLKSYIRAINSCIGIDLVRTAVRYYSERPDRVPRASSD